MITRELRQGNFVYEEKGEVACITGIDDDTRVSTDKGFFPYTPIDKIKPIPLSYAMNRKFGFLSNTVVVFLNKGYNAQRQNQNSRFKIYSINGTVYIARIDETDICEIKYVHQLQNLFYSLCGEELTLRQ